MTKLSFRFNLGFAFVLLTIFSNAQPQTIQSNHIVYEIVKNSYAIHDRDVIKENEIKQVAYSKDIRQSFDQGDEFSNRFGPYQIYQIRQTASEDKQIESKNIEVISNRKVLLRNIKTGRYAIFNGSILLKYSDKVALNQLIDRNPDIQLVHEFRNGNLVVLVANKNIKQSILEVYQSLSQDLLSGNLPGIEKISLDITEQFRFAR